MTGLAAPTPREADCRAWRDGWPPWTVAFTSAARPAGPPSSPQRSPMSEPASRPEFPHPERPHPEIPPPERPVSIVLADDAALLREGVRSLAEAAGLEVLASAGAGGARRYGRSRPRP